MDAAPLLAHILSQTKQNIEFLVAQKQISTGDGRDILSRLPNAPQALGYKTEALISKSEAALVQQTQRLSFNASSSSIPSSAATPAYTPDPPAPYQPPPAAASHGVSFQARASWDYNEAGQNPGDLSFRAGDVIDILAQTNNDWWTGRLNGREGLLPSSYVSRLPQPQGTLPSPAPTPYSEKPPSAAGYPMAPAYSSYQPPGGYQGPPPPSQAYSPYGGPPPSGPPGQVASPNPHADAQDPPKKSKFGGKFGSTLAHSAVGGAGFGAGSAIGSGLVNSIF
ncbi:SH3 domain-containing protein [Lyophyllum atratum]|nr:SH3 domain-containing protein [Lyophyllum atratum]